jgi:hypothetical protein
MVKQVNMIYADSKNVNLPSYNLQIKKLLSQNLKFSRLTVFFRKPFLSIGNFLMGHFVTMVNLQFWNNSSNTNMEIFQEQKISILTYINLS